MDVGNVFRTVSDTYRIPDNKIISLRVLRVTKKLVILTLGVTQHILTVAAAKVHVF